ncbi:uncharacterized protein SPAPADRAFT_66055 [Spathaspora passalidarum NRRL Y-27907]|uniref:C2H2-type domain-containing protein n=1 Tax=Spathaspora passalidarum (strain NRRL Y-27907 / 11-Y1) TaxID=619300 RepID=G3AL01_SPAPN|nr:uncharacterized protein SPAPADRAFT_66055 [Spathaspora passalidarum NRRL Y-27907]EGW33044.1 hypothetical protein SPAPADRAFT_66055 [Spathaspora passalidarum NRRL Y-27907]
MTLSKNRGTDTDWHGLALSHFSIASGISSQIKNQDLTGNRAPIHNRDTNMSSDPELKYIDNRWLYFHGLMIDQTSRQIVLNTPNTIVDQLGDTQIRQLARKQRALKSSKFLHFKYPSLIEFVAVEPLYLKYCQDEFLVRRKEQIPEWELLKGKKVLGTEVVNERMKVVIYIDEVDDTPIPKESVRYWKSERILEDCYQSIQFSQSYSESITRSLNSTYKNEGIYLYSKITHERNNKQKLNTTIQSCLERSIDEQNSNMREMSIYYFDCFSLFYQILVCVDLDLIMGETKTKIETLKTPQLDLDVKQQALKDLFVDFMSKNIILFVQILVPYLVNLEDSTFLDCFDCLKRLDVLKNFAISCMLLELDQGIFISLMSSASTTLNDKYEGWRILQIIYEQKKKEVLQNILENGNSKNIELPSLAELNATHDMAPFVEQTANSPLDAAGSRYKETSISATDNSASLEQIVILSDSEDEQDAITTVPAPVSTSVPEPAPAIENDSLLPLSSESPDKYCKGPDFSGLYSCSYDGCDFQSYKRFDMRKHIKRHLGTRYRCIQCLKKFDDIPKLESHVESHEVLVERVLPQHPLDEYCHGPGPRCIYTCIYDDCGERITFRVNMHLHIQSHLQESNLPIECLHCCKRFKSIKLLSTHLRFNHSDILEQFTHVQFKNYYNDYNKVNGYKCTYNNCGTCFTSKLVMEHHITKHLNEE